MSVSPEYWAGLFDGEGCVYIAKGKRTATRRGQYQLCVEVRMTSDEPIYLLKEEFGGTVTLQPAKPNLNKRGTFSWKARSLVGRQFLETIRPYTMIKSSQIDAALDFQALVSSRNHTGRIAISEEELQVREDYYQTLKRLKTVA